MTGRLLPLGDEAPWTGGAVSDWVTCLLAPNPSAWTLEGTNTWLIAAPGASDVIVIDPGPDEIEHLERIATAAAERGRVAQILLTHGHADHSEGARTLAESLGIGVRALDPAHRRILLVAGGISDQPLAWLEAMDSIGRSVAEFQRPEA